MESPTVIDSCPGLVEAVSAKMKEMQHQVECLHLKVLEYKRLKLVADMYESEQEAAVRKADSLAYDAYVQLTVEMVRFRKYQADLREELDNMLKQLNQATVTQLDIPAPPRRSWEFYAPARELLEGTVAVETAAVLLPQAGIAEDVVVAAKALCDQFVRDTGVVVGPAPEELIKRTPAMELIDVQYHASKILAQDFAGLKNKTVTKPADTETA